MDDKQMLYQQRAEMLKALAHPVRLRIVRGLLQCGCRNVSCMERATGHSQHLNRLRHAGVLECARSGNEVYYKVADERVADIIAALFDGEEADCL